MEYSHIAPILGQLWSPIAAVSSHWDGKDNAQICVSIGGASIVPERPRVLVQIYKTNHSHEMITKSGAFALNFPRAGQLDWIPDFGMHSGREDDKLATVEYSAGKTGSPLFADCWGWLGLRGGQRNGRRGPDMLSRGRGGRAHDRAGPADVVARGTAAHPGGVGCGRTRKSSRVRSRFQERTWMRLISRHGAAPAGNTADGHIPGGL